MMYYAGPAQARGYDRPLPAQEAVSAGKIETNHCTFTSRRIYDRCNVELYNKTGILATLLPPSFETFVEFAESACEKFKGKAKRRENVVGARLPRNVAHKDPGLLPYMSDQAPDINDPAGGATHDQNADILGKNRRNDLSVYGHFGPSRRGPIAKRT